MPLVFYLESNPKNTIISMTYLFTSESVSEGHPDKIADQISDSLLDNFLAYDPSSKVACEVMVTTGQVILAGEVKSRTYLDLQEITRKVINDIGYTQEAYRFCGDSCGILSMIHEQSQEINQGVEKLHGQDQGAGDQGIMFGYATRETKNFMPLGIELANLILKELATIRRQGEVMTYLRPDAKCQVTVEYSDRNEPLRVHTIVLSTQHDPFDIDDHRMLHRIKSDVIAILMERVKAKLPAKLQRLFSKELIYHINPTGKFVLGGPHGDTGLTGRKIVVDTYGGKGAHGGGAFSGKDPSKVDRSAAYAARYIAKNLVAAGVADEILVQLSYAIGIADPVGVYINTNQNNRTAMTDSEIAEVISKNFDFRPAALEKHFKLRSPIYRETAAYGHMGRLPEKKVKVFDSQHFGRITQEVELFTWEKLDFIDVIKKEIKF